MVMTIEILGPSGVVHYTRPADHPLVIEALTTPGYAVRWPGCRDMSLLAELPMPNPGGQLTFPDEGMTLACPRTEPVPNA